jgi:hypothetical protein
MAEAFMRSTLFLATTAIANTLMVAASAMGQIASTEVTERDGTTRRGGGRRAPSSHR